MLCIVCNRCDSVSHATGNTRDELPVCGGINIEATGNVHICQCIPDQLRNPRQAYATICALTDNLDMAGIRDLLRNAEVRRPINLRTSI